MGCEQLRKTDCGIGWARWFVAGVLFVASPALCSGTDQGPTGSPGSVRGESIAVQGRVVRGFEVNEGQADAQVRFLLRGRSSTLYLTAEEAVLSLRNAAPTTPTSIALEDSVEPPQSGSQPSDDRSAVVRIRPVGASPSVAVLGQEPLLGEVNYFIGRDPEKWRTAITTYAKVVYQGLYPGVDLIYHACQGQLEYDFVVAPGTSPSTITLSFHGIEALRISPEGDLILHTTAGDVRQTRPIGYQEGGGFRRIVPVEYVLRGEDEVGVMVSDYDPARPLTIDPVITYSTFLGGLGENNSSGIGLDGDGNIYMAGLTVSTDFPTTSSYQPTNAGGYDAFVTKMNPAGDTLLYSTYLGGSGPNDYGMSLAVDTAGRAYVAGLTDSVDFPVTAGAFDASCGSDGACNTGVWDAFVTALSPDGSSLIYSTYLGGGGDDRGIDIVLGAAREVYVTGATASNDFPTASPFQPTFGGGTFDAFVARVDTTATGAASLIYSTYLGGSGQDRGVGIALDSSRRIYVTGRTASSDFPTSGPLQAANAGGTFDAYVAKLSASGGAFLYSTYLGGGGDDQGIDIAVDGGDNAYVTGSTTSVNFPTTAGTFDSSCGTDGLCNGGNMDVFVTKVNSAGSSLAYSTYLGGGSYEAPQGIEVNAAGCAHVTGYTDSTNFPLANPFQATCGCGGGFIEAFVTKMDPAGGSLVYSSYLGGNSSDYGIEIALDNSGVVYLSGETFSNTFPTLNPLQSTRSGNYDAFLTMIATSSDLSLTKTDSPDPVLTGSELMYTIVATNNGPDAATGVTVSDPLPAGMSFLSAETTQGSCSESSGTVACNLGTLASFGTATVTIRVRPTVAGNASNTTTITSTEGDSDLGNNAATASTTVQAIRGDANGDTTVSVADVFYLINNLFAGGPPPTASCGGDANNDGATSVADVFYLINYLFAGGSAPGSC